MVWLVVGILGAMAVAVSSQKMMSVPSHDGSVTVLIDPQTGTISSISSTGGPNPIEVDVSVNPSISGARMLMQSAKDLGGDKGVLIQTFLCLPGGDVPCAAQKAACNLTVSPQATSVRIDMSFEGEMDAGVPPWTSPINLDFNFTDASKLKIWAPWNRNGEDALNPSDGGYSWWDGTYAFGNSFGSPDFIVAEQFSVIDSKAGGAFHIVGDPGNQPVPRGWLYLAGKGGAACTSPSSCPGSAAATFSYEKLRLLPGVVHTRGFDVVASAACYRPGLAWSMVAYPEYWSPVHGAASRFVDGLGSYSSYLGSLADPQWKALGYQTNWDLSGRFFPYMGMFLPPMDGPTDPWKNDVEGTQTRANCSYNSIDKNYADIQAEGFSTLSYFNVFEYGINVQHGDDRGTVPATLNQENWPNASLYLENNFRPALVTNFVCAGGSPCNSREWAPVEGKSQSSWQGSVVVDPREGLGYDASLLSQIQRKITALPHFQGIVIDRSDWNQLVNLDGDDGYTLIGNRTGWSMKYSYLQILPRLRAALEKAQKPGASPYIMLDNTVGFGWLPFMKSFDGTYSEGANFNSVGLLGLDSTSILWTSSRKECCSTAAAADTYFQARLRMGVFPQAPFPENDHCIQPDPNSTADYLRYGALFTAIRNASWVLDPMPISLSNDSIKSNAFRGGEGGTSLLYPIVFGGSTTRVVVNLAHLPAAIGALDADVMHPGMGATWQPIILQAGTEAGAASAAVPLVSGCGLLRVRVKSSHP